MTTTQTFSEVSQARLAQALEEYYANLESGETVPREQLLSKYSDIADELACCLDSLDFVSNIAPELASRASSDTSIATPLSERAFLGDFRIERQIGRGGMGVVYEAEQLSLGRRVALKVLPLAAMLDDRQLQRFKNEAKAAALLQHPNIVPVHGIGVERGVHYYAMQLIEGTTLAAVIADLRQAEPPGETEDASTGNDCDDAKPVAMGSTKQNESPEPDETQPAATLSTQYHHDRHRFFRSVARVGQQAAHALHHAHQAGIVHRDIKPSNLIIDRNGTVWVADFGLAQFHSDHTLTASGDFLGTLRYMSPERLDESGVVDHRCDVYSLGVTLYELAVRREAFGGESREQIVRRILNETLPAPRKLDSRVPVDLETIIQKATSKEPESRYASAAEFAEDLRRFIESKPVHARRASRTELLRSWAGRNPLPAALAVVVVCLLAALAVGSMVFALHAMDGARRESALLAQASTRLYGSEIRRAQSLIEQGDILAGEEVLLRYVPQPDEPDLRGFEWSYLWEQIHRAAPDRLFDHGVPGYQVSYSSDGRRIVTGSWGGLVNVWDRATGARLLKLTNDAHRGPIAGLGFMDGGAALISVARYGTIGRWDLPSPEPTWLIQHADSLRIKHVAMAPQRKLVAMSLASPNQSYVQGDLGHVIVWDLQSRNSVARFDGIPGKPLAVFSADESRLVISGFDGRLRVVDTATWTQENDFAAHDSPISALAVCNGVLATGGGVDGPLRSGAVKLWDTFTWQALETLQAHDDCVQSLEFSHDGSRLVSGSQDGSVALWRVEPGGQLKAINCIKAHSEGVNGIAFAPNDSEFCTVSTDRTCRVWNPRRIESLGRSHWGQRRETKVGLALAADDELLCISSGFGKPVEVLDAKTGQLRHTIETNGATFNDLAVSPCGTRLAVAAGHFPINESTPPGDFRLYDVNTGTEVRRFKFKTDRPFTCRGIGFSSDGGLLVAACWKHLVVWDVATGVEINQVPLDCWFKAFRVHPTEPLVACGTTNGFTSFYELPSLQRLKHEQTEEGTLESIDFSPDGKYFATGGAEQQVKLWDAETFKLERRFSGSSNWVTHVRFSPDGRRILSGCMNGHLYLSDVATGEHLLKLPVDPTWIFNGEFSRDASSIVAAGDRVHLWKCADRWQELRRLPVQSLPRICEQ